MSIETSGGTHKSPTPRKPTPRANGAASASKVQRRARPPKVTGVQTPAAGTPAAGTPISATSSQTAHRRRFHPLRKLFKKGSSTGNSAGSFTTSTTGAAPPFAVPSPQQRRSQRQAGGTQPKPASRVPLRAIALTTVALVVLAIAGIIALTVLSHTSAFAIESVVATASDHVSEENIIRLADIEEGTTLLNLDTDTITNNIKRNPWVAEVSLDRVFPSTLRINIKERSVKALVIMNSGEVVWCLGDGNVWIEPISVKAGKDEEFTSVALATAQKMHTTLISDSPASVSPVAGAAATDDSLLAVNTIIDEFSSDFAKDVVSYSAPSAESISCTLSSGVTISLGNASDVATKEAIILSLLEKYPDRLTYINVRVPSNPSYRMVGVDNVQEGSGPFGESGADSQVAEESEKTAEQGMAKPKSDSDESAGSSSDENTDDEG